MRSISGWRGRTPTSRGVGMRMTDWYTAGTSRKRKPSRQSFRPAWRNATWKCIRRKPRSSTAKTGNAKASIRTFNLTSSGIAFGPVWFDAPRTAHCSGFNPAVSVSALKAMRATIRELDLRHRTQLSLGEIARQINPLLRGWIEYYGRYAPSALKPMLRYVNQTLLAWAIRKFKRFRLTRFARVAFFKD